jgi:uncharacterized protein (DUF433 family)
MADFGQHICIDADSLAGNPVECDTHIPLSLVLNLLGHGYTFDRVIESYPPRRPGDIQAALKFSARRVVRAETRDPHLTM